VTGGSDSVWSRHANTASRSTTRGPGPLGQPRGEPGQPVVDHVVGVEEHTARPQHVAKLAVERVVIPVRKKVCQPQFGPELFPLGTPGEPGGAWGR
jgi:hypothetical protein